MRKRPYRRVRGRLSELRQPVSAAGCRWHSCCAEAIIQVISVAPRGQALAIGFSERGQERRASSHCVTLFYPTDIFVTAAAPPFRGMVHPSHSAE